MSQTFELVRHGTKQNEETNPWASDEEQESFLRGETPPELRNYLAAGISERAARQAFDAGVGADVLLRLLRA